MTVVRGFRFLTVPWGWLLPYKGVLFALPYALLLIMRLFALTLALLLFMRLFEPL